MTGCYISAIILHGHHPYIQSQNTVSPLNLKYYEIQYLKAISIFDVFLIYTL